MKEEFTPVGEDLAIALRALGHPVRLNILSILAQKCNNQCCCTDVTNCLPLAQSTVSQHIKVLLEAGLVERHAKGTRNCYTVCEDKLNAFRATYENYMSALSNDLARKPSVQNPESV